LTENIYIGIKKIIILNICKISKKFWGGEESRHLGPPPRYGLEVHRSKWMIEKYGHKLSVELGENKSKL
jgi:hypothetical protein